MNLNDFNDCQDHQVLNNLKKPDGSKHYIADIVYINAERRSKKIKV